MAQEHLNVLLNNLGLEPTDIEAIQGLEEGAEFTPDDYVGKIISKSETAVKNDPKFWESLDENNVNEGFKKKIEAQQYGRAVNTVRQKTLKAFGLKDEDVADLSEEEKKNLEVFISKAAEKYSSTKVSDKQLQAELLEARKKYEELELKIPESEGKIKQDYEERFNNEKLDFILLAELAELSTTHKLKAPPAYLIKELAASLKDANAFVINGLKALPKQKSNPSLDVVEGSKILTTKDLILKKLLADGLIEEADPNPQPGKGTFKARVEPDGAGKLGISADVLAKIQANA